MPPRAKPNPRIKASVNWRDVTHTAPWGADKEPVAINAFYGYAFESHKGFPLHHDNWKDRTGRAGRDSGKRVNVLLWSEEAIRGVLNDQPDRVEDALRHPTAHINTRVTGGRSGGPYHFFNTGIFTKELMQSQIESSQKVPSVSQSQRAQSVARLTQSPSTARLPQGYRETLDSCNPMPRYYAPDQWKQIDENLDELGHYAERSSVVFDRVVNGDTLLVLAVRRDSFRAAQRIVELGVDVLARNVNGESVVAMLEEVSCGSLRHLSETRVNPDRADRAPGPPACKHDARRGRTARSTGTLDIAPRNRRDRVRDELFCSFSYHRRRRTSRKS